MRPDVLQRLTDIHTAAELILEYTRDLTEREYCADVRTRDAVDRRLAIVGEAMGRLLKLDASYASCFPEAREIISLRNVLIHDYGQVDDEFIWRLVVQEMPDLLRRVKVEMRRIEEAK